MRVRRALRDTLNSSGEIEAAPAKLPCWKFRVGKTLSRLKASRFEAVPNSRYLEVAGPKDFSESCFARIARPDGLAQLKLVLGPAHGNCFHPL